MSTKNGGAEAWHPARLIPTAGIKGTREQEQRATSALLSVMKAVPEFGRELLDDLGAPSGKRTKLDTYVEVSLDDGNGGVVRPDGAIVADSGNRRWCALVEVKTGDNQSRTEQVLAYVDAAIREGFDGVLMIDNTILGGAQDVPVEIPKAKLRKVSVWQLSWWRIVTEAILQHDYRGVSDPDQAWILSELIAYLSHERSGVAQLGDMGPSWVPTRDGARHNTLNKRQAEVADIARRWEQFVHWVALGFTQETGVDVVPDRIKRDFADRIEATKEELVEHGTLSMRLRIPDTVGPLSLTADLRAQMVTTSVTIKAPGEGRADTRVRWILRQLKNAPDDMRIATKFVSTSKRTAVLLHDVRDDVKSALLADDPKREPREFELSLARPMGIKRGSGQGGFITDTRQQAIDFYRELFQQLTEWRPKAPKLREKRPERTGKAPGTETPSDSTPQHSTRSQPSEAPNVQQAEEASVPRATPSDRP
ncbi:MAG: stress response protein [Dehalococcoidia bacterium]